MSRLLSSLIALCALLLVGCSSLKHVPPGSKLLNSVDIAIDGDNSVSASTLYNYLRQVPNHKALGFAKLSLGIYNISGRDSTKWYNRWIRSIGQAPVLYSPELTEQSVRQLQLALINRGYNHASVTVDSVLSRGGRKIDLRYNIVTGSPHIVDSVNIVIDDPYIQQMLSADPSPIALHSGTPLDRDMLEKQRTAVASYLRDRGYYTFNKDYITYIADTIAGSQGVGLTMHLHRPTVADDSAAVHRRFIVKRVIFDLDDRPQALDDTLDLGNGMALVYGPDRWLRPSILEEKCYIRPGMPYNATDVSRTYEALTQLGIVKFVNIAMVPAGSTADTDLLNAVVTLSRSSKQTISFEVDGTNSEGDLGFGVGVNYLHRNIFHGAEQLSTKFRVAYESLSGNPGGLINNRYTEYSGEVGLTFPKFVAPFVSKSFKQRMKAVTEFAVSLNYQERPEYTRIISGAAWKYKWNNRDNTRRHTFDLIDINYVNLPKSSIDFINTVAPHNPLLRYSYEDHLIMRIGYTYYRTNRRQQSTSAIFGNSLMQTDIYTLRASAETAGNILYGISSLLDRPKHDGAYMVFNTQFAQYAKAEADYTFLHNFNSRNSIAFHIGAGIAVPYGNSSMVPFEKRFYAGGANSVRGWSVRTLGPGCYDSRNSVTNFINQCGDIRLDLNVEYRMKLFWKFEGALFIDAGNIWTIRDYENQPGGVFRFDSFYKQIAAAYGAGLRLDVTYVILRLDLGMKAHNPARGQQPWPLLHPDWSRDRTIHFSIGYPF